MTTSRKSPDPKRLRTAYAACQPRYSSALTQLQREVQSVLSREGAVFTVKSRVKSFESYLAKTVRLHVSEVPAPVTDMFGLRIICPFLDDIERVRELMIANFSVTETESKGANRSFHEFGYDSLHLLIKLPGDIRVRKLPHMETVCEVQIRTTLQDAWAEVEHELVYKADSSLLSEPIQRKLAALNANLTLSDIIFQEIRDYHREIKDRGRKRRESLQDKIETFDRAAALDDLESMSGNPAHDRTHAPKPRSRFERLVFDALEAHSQKRLSEAVTIYTQILAMRLPSPVRSIIYNHRGMAHFVQSKYKQAIADFSKSIDYNAENLAALNNRGLTRRLLHQYEEALADFNRSLDVNAYQAAVYHSRALAHCDIGDVIKALADCETALSLAPGFAAAVSLRDVVREKLSG